MSDTPIKIGTLDRLNQLESFSDQMKAAPTWGEQKMADTLDELRIEYVPQWIFGQYIADFYLPRYHVIVEVNGSIHLTPKQIEKDKRRNQYFHDNGIRVFVAWNKELFHIKNKLKAFLKPKRGNRKKPKTKPVKLTREQNQEMQGLAINRKRRELLLNPPIQSVIEKKSRGIISERNFIKAYKNASAVHIKYNIPFLREAQLKELASLNV